MTTDRAKWEKLPASGISGVAKSAGLSVGFTDSAHAQHTMSFAQTRLLSAKAAAKYSGGETYTFSTWSGKLTKTDKTTCWFIFWTTKPNDYGVIGFAVKVNKHITQKEVLGHHIYTEQFKPFSNYNGFTEEAIICIKWYAVSINGAFERW